MKDKKLHPPGMGRAVFRLVLLIEEIVMKTGFLKIRYITA